jgi:predicted kinase
LKKPAFILINGMPCTGKTTLGSYLARELSLPLVSKDGIKEVLYDTLGTLDRAWSQQLGSASMEILYYFIEAELRSGASFIAEANYHADLAGEKLIKLLSGKNQRVIQILCRTEPATLLDRYDRRAHSTDRHAGHLDLYNRADFAALVNKGEWPPVPIDCELLAVDTTHLDAEGYTELANRIRPLIDYQGGT